MKRRLTGKLGLSDDNLNTNFMPNQIIKVKSYQNGDKKNLCGKKLHQKQIEKLYANFFLSENNCSIDVTCIEMNMIKLCEDFTIDCR
ncbi:hypothetical protein DERP_005802 [Dermatophagoides pteronyssinus]|uniref:Uncharacterized protein n=1 Tax=Dermatophagoides pteronyssinus TaxID=6956 RepID=A0ABQ8JA26_DERPT|nr:hypothetical protein DERP_005802 [Dermatophagoides pteronyssinus]